MKNYTKYKRNEENKDGQSVFCIQTFQSRAAFGSHSINRTSMYWADKSQNRSITCTNGLAIRSGFPNRYSIIVITDCFTIIFLGLNAASSSLLTAL